MQTVLTLEVFLSLLLAVALGAVAGIVAGIGFIGAGTIWAEKDKVKGITTAASLWATAAIGLTTGIGRLSTSCDGNHPRRHHFSIKISSAKTED